MTFSVSKMQKVVEAWLAAHEPEPPVRDHRLVSRFVLPLELAPPLNQLAEMPPWRRRKVKQAAGQMMFVQAKNRGRRPLPGVPAVRAIRFSSKQPDWDSAWTKIPLDRLRDLGYLVDDSPGHVSLLVSWERASPGDGFVLLDLWAEGEKK